MANVLNTDKQIAVISALAVEIQEAERRVSELSERKQSLGLK